MLIDLIMNVTQSIATLSQPKHKRSLSSEMISWAMPDKLR